MSVRSVFEIDIRDDRFRAFNALFDKYVASVKTLPALWQKVGKAAGRDQANSFVRLAEGVGTTNLGGKRAAEETKKIRADTQRAATNWSGIARSAKSFAGSVKDATLNFTKWVGIGGIISGLAGAGGLWGLDRLGEGVSATRRSAMGLGLSYGGLQATQTDFARVTDPASFLGGVNEALTDVTKRWTLYGAGLTERDLKGKDTGQVGALLLKKIEPLLDRTPTAMLAQVAQAFGLNQFMSNEDLRRWKDMPENERSSVLRGFGSDSMAFGLPAGTQRSWQEFTTQMGKAKISIENAFVKGLVPLVSGPNGGALGNLSRSLVMAVDTIFGVAKKNRWIDSFTKGIDDFAAWMRGPQFKTDLTKFETNIAEAGKTIGGILPSLRGFESILSTINNIWNPPVLVEDQKKAEAHQKAIQTPNRAGWYFDQSTSTWRQSNSSPAAKSWMNPLSWFNKSGTGNNPGNLRVPGSTRFQAFGSLDEGINKMARQLLRDQDVHGQTTLRQIIGGNKAWPGWAPAADHNDVGAYLRSLKKTTGIDADAPVNLHDAATMSKVIRGISVQEGRHALSSADIARALGTKAQSPIKVAVKIDNAAGANTVVTGSQLGRGF
jgi:hypothetical protein